MRVKARLTSPYLDQVSTPPPSPSSDSTFGALAVLFPTDPLIARDDAGWYLSASEMDEADDSDNRWGAHNVADRLVRTINGIAALFRHGSVSPVRLTGLLDGRISSGRFTVLTSLVGRSTTFERLDPASATALLNLADTESAVSDVIDFLGHTNQDWMWFDLYRVWDIMKSRYPQGSTDFFDWVSSIDPSYADKYYDFENSANDPSFGSDRRHALRNYKPPTNWRTGRVAQGMDPQQALLFVKSVALKWIKDEFKTPLVAQFNV